MTAPRPRPAWTPFVLLGLMTLVTVRRPARHLSLRSGRREPGLAPRPAVEWWTFGLAIVGLMLACSWLACLGFGSASAGGGRSPTLKLE